MVGCRANETTKTDCIKILSTCPALTDIHSSCDFWGQMLRLYTAMRSDLWLPSPEQRLVANSPNSPYHRFLVNMTDTDSFGAPRPLVALPLYVKSGHQWNTVGGKEWGGGKVPERERLELMVLHLPGSMSIMALITLSKESISLFSFLLHAP